MTQLAWGAKVSGSFCSRVIEIAQGLGCDPSWLMACMAFETGQTFDPAKRNPVSGATGLIQFMPSTAQIMGTTVDALAAMDAVTQLNAVDAYLRPYSGHFKDLASLYMAILWPKAVDLPSDNVVFRAGSKAFLQNAGLDINHDGDVTKAECASFVQRQLEIGMQPENVREYDAAEQQPAAAPAPATTGAPTMGIAIPLLSAILPQIMQLFSGRAQAQIAKATGSDPAAAGQFMQSLITEVGKAVGVPVKDDASAVQAVAAVTAQPAPQQAETVAKLETFSLDTLAPTLDKMAGYDKDLWAAQIAGRESAAAVALQEKWDMTPWLVWLAGGTATILVLVLAGGLVYQAVWKDDINSGLIGLAGPIIMGAIGVWRQIFDYRFDSTHASSATQAAQSAVNLELAKGQSK